jgi:hypothetical protein
VRIAGHRGRQPQWEKEVASPADIEDAGYWLRRAKKARTHAKQMSNERHKEMMLEIANEYDDLAVKATIR